MHAALQPQSAGGEPGMPGGAGAVAVLHRCEAVDDAGSGRASGCDAVTLDCVQADIDLHREQFDSALLAVEALVNAGLYESHLALPLSQGLGKVFQTLEQLVADGVGPSAQLAAVAEKVRLRVEELHTRVLAESDGG